MKGVCGYSFLEEGRGDPWWLNCGLCVGMEMVCGRRWMDGLKVEEEDRVEVWVIWLVICCKGRWVRVPSDLVTNGRRRDTKRPLQRCNGGEESSAVKVCVCTCVLEEREEKAAWP